MRQLLCSIYDNAVGAYHVPFACRSKSEAIRTFSDLVQNSETTINKHPEDYHLFCLGAFDDNSGQLEPLTTPEKFITGNECKSV
ncbi:nonstructural protein [robinz microvirus RP_143]|nr:nonstructural protein [robinz microvirus RP_143]